MKGNDGTGNITERDLWETPKDLFNKLHKQYNFVFDCCANKENKKCPLYSKDFLNSSTTILIAKQTKINFWINPPFSQAYPMIYHFFKIVKNGVGIYRCDNMETKIWQDIILKNADWILIPNKRINYENFEGKGSRFPSALFGIGVEIPKHVKGRILEVIK